MYRLTVNNVKLTFSFVQFVSRKSHVYTCINIYGKSNNELSDKLTRHFNCLFYQFNIFLCILWQLFIISYILYICLPARNSNIFNLKYVQVQISLLQLLHQTVGVQTNIVHFCLTKRKTSSAKCYMCIVKIFIF